MDNLEKIQRRATRMMEELRGMEYEERLRQTRLVTLEARRTRAGIIEMFKIMKGLEGLNREDFFEMEVDKRTRGHTLKILKMGARLDCRKYSFSQRVVIVGDPQPQKLNKKSWTWHGLLYFLFYFFLLVWPLRSPDWEVCLAGNIAEKNCGYF